MGLAALPDQRPRPRLLPVRPHQGHLQGRVGGAETLDSLFEFFDKPFLVFLDLVLVVAVLYHALNGVRIMLMDFGVGIKRHKVVFWICMAVAVVCFARLRLRGLHLHRLRQGADELRAETSRSQPRRHVALAVPARHRRALIVTIMVHLSSRTFVTIGELSYDNIGERLAMPARARQSTSSCWRPVIYHALNGLRMVVLDYWFTGTRRAARFDRRSSGSSASSAIVYGIWALWVWIS